MTDRQEYAADTDPRDRNDYLRITNIERGVPPHSPTYLIVEWTSEPIRIYRLERRAALDSASPWEHHVTGFENLLGWTAVGFDESAQQHFYRVQARRPLMP